MFQNYPKPVVYTPGDNDWTDCHRTGQDPIERLKQLRKMFYYDAKTLRLNELNVQQQSQNPKYKKYIENYRFTKSNVLFVVAPLSAVITIFGRSLFLLWTNLDKETLQLLHF